MISITIASSVLAWTFSLQHQDRQLSLLLRPCLLQTSSCFVSWRASWAKRAIYSSFESLELHLVWMTQGERAFQVWSRWHLLLPASSAQSFFPRSYEANLGRMFCRLCSQRWKQSCDQAEALLRFPSQADSSCRLDGSSRNRKRSWEWESWSEECWLVSLVHFCTQISRQIGRLADSLDYSTFCRAESIDLNNGSVSCWYHSYLWHRGCRWALL